MLQFPANNAEVDGAEADASGDGEISFIFDIETNGFNPSVVHCIALMCVQTQEMFVCADQPGYLSISLALELLEGADWVIGHNVLSYDLPVLERLYSGFKIDRARVLDTYPLARSYFPDIVRSDRLLESLPSPLRGKHKLEAWGYRLGMQKGKFGQTTDWRHFSPEMAQYCAGDVRVTALLHELLMLVAEEDANNSTSDHLVEYACS